MLVENAVGAHLMNNLQGMQFQVYYWRQRNDEVDFVVHAPSGIFAIEVKSGRPRRPPGLRAFTKKYPQATPIIIGLGGLDPEEFFRADPRTLFG